MVDAPVSSLKAAPFAARWLLLIHQLPPAPDYLRVKVRRRIQRLGAVLLKSTVYVLPYRESCLEDFQWLANEIAAEGGDATIVAGELLSGVADREIEDLFRAERAAEYREVADQARAVEPESPDASRRIARLREKLDAIAARDFFDAPDRREAERAIARAHPPTLPEPKASSTSREAPPRPRSATWVTRAGVFIDRIASAWLIRRFIDPRARFKFVDAAHYRPSPGELRFDMYRAEFTHEGDACTFETLLTRFQLGDDPALRAIGEIVHDIDLKDAKFERAEIPGVLAIMQGIATAVDDDAERLSRGALVFDGLYTQLGNSAL